MRTVAAVLVAAILGLISAGCEKTIKDVRANPTDAVALHDSPAQP